MFTPEHRSSGPGFHVSSPRPADVLMVWGLRRIYSRFDIALDLLNRHSGIVWDPGQFRAVAPRMLRWIQ